MSPIAYVEVGSTGNHVSHKFDGDVHVVVENPGTKLAVTKRVIFDNKSVVPILKDLIDKKELERWTVKRNPSVILRIETDNNGKVFENEWMTPNGYYLLGVVSEMIE